MFRRAHTNIVSIRFDTLKEPSAMHAGEVINCSQCDAILSNISNIEEDGPDKVRLHVIDFHTLKFKNRNSRKRMFQMQETRGIVILPIQHRKCNSESYIH